VAPYPERRAITILRTHPRLLAVLTLGLLGCGPLDDEPPPSVDVVEQAVTTTSSEYKLSASVDPDVRGDLATEIWARVYRPATLTSGKKYPLLIFLHGNHSTCGHGSNPRIDDRNDYTFTGKCPSGYVVVPNHRGFDYAANALAATDGYIVVSINANRGVAGADESSLTGDWGNVLVGGRLVLKHLAKLSRWNRGLEATPSSLGFSLKGRLDLTQVGLMGHSRGGEGVRAAYFQYRDVGSPWPARIPEPVTFRGLFEIAPSDGGSYQVLDAPGLKWVVLLPMCDGDLASLPGIHPFDRMLSNRDESPESFKATFTVWGANHNFFNSQWQVSDSTGCQLHTPIFSATGTSSTRQQDVARIAMTSLFQGSVGKTSSTPRRVFNPLYALPSSVSSITRVDRGYTSAADADVSLMLEDFLAPTGYNSYGLANEVLNITMSHEMLSEHATHDVAPGAWISWTRAGAGVYFQSNFAETPGGIILSSYKTLDLRLERADDPILNVPGASTDFSVQLVNGDGTLSAPVRVSQHVSLMGPVGSASRLHMMLQTARIPLKKFIGADLDRVSAVRLTFDQTHYGKILISHIRASGSADDTTALAALGFADILQAPPAAAPAATASAAVPRRVITGNTLVGLRALGGPSLVAGASGVDVEVRSDEPFAVRDALLELQVGPTTVRGVRHPDPGDLRRAVFRLSAEQFAAVRDGDPMTITYGEDSTIAWTFAPLVKRLQ
jgi:hypothetical protein